MIVGRLGVARGLRSGRRCLLTREEYLALDRGSWDKWEWIAVRLDPATGAPDPADLERLGWPGEVGSGWPEDDPGVPDAVQ